MLQIMNPRPLELSHSGGSSQGNIGIVVKCWENARPLIKELERTVNFAERKCGDLMQELNLCKEYYEKWATERVATTTVHKRKPRRRPNRKSESIRSSSENESEITTTQQISNNFNEKLRNKIYEITNEIKEANRKIVLKEATFTSNPKKNIENESVPHLKENSEESGGDKKCDVINNHVTKSEPNIADAKSEKDMKRESMQSLQRTPSKVASRKRPPILVKRHSMQKYKLRSKSLPQGVRRKFGFGSFVEIVDNQRPNFGKLLTVKSRTTVSSGSKSNLGKERGRPKSRSVEKPKSRATEKSNHSRSISRHEVEKSESIKNMNCSGDAQSYTLVVKNKSQSQNLTQNVQSCSNFSNDIGSGQTKVNAGYLSEGNGANKVVKFENIFAGKLAPRQPIPFTICRTSKTFNLGLNIQQVLSMIKNKRHSAMLQAIIKDNIRTARSVVHKTEPNINALYIATSSRIARTDDSEMCPARDDGDHCYSVISSHTGSSIKCKMQTCRQAEGQNVIKYDGNDTVPLTLPIVREIKLNDIQRPEDVWVVEQPDHNQSIQRYRTRCTCFPRRDSVDYQKVLQQYSTMKQKTNGYLPGSFCHSNFPAGFIMSELCPLPSRPQITYNEKLIGAKLEFKKVQEDLDHLSRRFERIQEQLMDHNMNDYEMDAELEALELELNYREQDCKAILNFYNQLISLKKKIRDLRGRIRSTTNITDINAKPQRSKKDPFRPTPSMTLTRVLRQIQCLQDKIKLIDSPSIT